MSAAPLLSVAAHIYDDTTMKPHSHSPDVIWVGDLSGTGTIQLTFASSEAAERLAALAHQAAVGMREAEIKALQ